VRSPRRTAAAAAALVLLAGGCSDRGGDAGSAAPVDPSAVPPTAAEVTGPAIRGTVRTPDGAAVPGARVEVTLVRTKEERRGVGIGAAFSLGLTCIVDKRGCRAPHRDGVSASDGTFAIAMPVNNGDPPIGVAVSVVATAAGTRADDTSADDTGADDTGADGTSRVGTTVVLPAKAAKGAEVDVPVAAGALRLVRGGNDLRVRMPAVPGARPSGAVAVSLTQLAKDGDVSAATTDFSETTVGLPFDVRLAEDSRLLVTARQAARLRGMEATLSATNVLAGGAVPVSRDAPCSLTDSRGKARPQKPCGLTDGTLGSPWAPDDDPRCAQGPCPGTVQDDHRDVVVRLARAVPAKLLVVRGCGFTCVVSVSSDGKRYRELPAPDSASSTDGFYVQKLSGLPVRSVRVRTATGGFFLKLREVSVFR
jgi:hypothetical protein